MSYLPIHGANSTAKIRSVVYVAIMTVITLGVYVLFWWYYINREMADYGRAHASAELGDGPGKSTLALFLGGLIIVPAIWTMVTTFKRVRLRNACRGRSHSTAGSGCCSTSSFFHSSSLTARTCKTGSTTCGAPRPPNPPSCLRRSPPA